MSVETQPRGLGETEPGTFVDDAAVVDAEPELDGLGPRIGRFSILRKVGAGGMGVVYAGYDEELDRKVAIKLLHRRTGAQARERLTREAQGLARLSHPNVVQVYEIAEHEGAAFIAMEFVEGRTLKAYRAERPEAHWSELLGLMLDAGRGLAAAHDKGLVHRDFKPDNVMVDVDGRVRVMDFGLVHEGNEGHESEVGQLDPYETVDEPSDERISVSGRSALSNQLTQTGALLGTPAYMAPEQLQGLPTDARSDQFSFCVAAWELLYAERPFAGTTLAQLCVEVTSGTVREPPRDAEVPAWVRRVIERGLALAPNDRWPSMTALLVALGRDPTRGRRRILAAVAVVATVLAGVGIRGLVGDASRERTEARCRAEGEALAEVWNPSVAAELEQGFAATELGFAADSWARTRAQLDRYAQRWTEVQTTTCLEAERDQSRPPEYRRAVEGCLAEARVALAATVEVLASVDAPLVARAVSLATELPDLGECSDGAALARRSTPPPEIVDALAQQRVELERARVLQTSTRYTEALTRANAVVEAATELGFAPFEAEAWLLVGGIQHELGEYEEAATSVRRAFTLAAEAQADLLALRAVTKLTRVVGYDLARHAEGLLWGELGEVFVVRLELQASVPAALLQNEIATVAGEAGDTERASAGYESALAILEAKLGPHHPDVAMLAHNLGTQHMLLGDQDQARHLLERSLAIREELFGPNHPSVADSLTNLGGVYDDLGEYERAQLLHARALEIREIAFEPNHPKIASSLLALGALALYRGDYDGGIARFEHALKIREQAHGPKHPRVAGLLDSLGAAHAMRGEPEIAAGYFARSLEILAQTSGTRTRNYANALSNIASSQVSAGNFEAGEAALEEAVAIFEAVIGPESREVAVTLRARGSLELDRGRPREALRYLEQARDRLSAALGPDHIELGTTAFYTGCAQLELGQHQAAVDSLSKALELELAAGYGEDIVADTRFHLAQALWAVGERARARELALAARDGFAAAQFDDGMLGEVDTWLAGLKKGF